MQLQHDWDLRKFRRSKQAEREQRDEYPSSEVVLESNRVTEEEKIVRRGSSLKSLPEDLNS